LFLHKEKAVLGRLWILNWWRRGESNPRPQTLRHKVYMLIPCFCLTHSYPTGQENYQRFRLSLTLPATNEALARSYVRWPLSVPKNSARISTHSQRNGAGFTQLKPLS